MIIHVKLIFFIICVIELIIRFNLFLKFKKTKNITLKLIRLTSLKKVSDFWKEKALFNYSKNIFLNSLQIILIFLIIYIFYLFVIHHDKIMNDYFFSIFGFFETSVLALIYFRFRGVKNG